MMEQFWQNFWVRASLKSDCHECPYKKDCQEGKYDTKDHRANCDEILRKEYDRFVGSQIDKFPWEEEE